MDWYNCLWYGFGACSGISCCSCIKNNQQPTPEEFNKIYLDHQKMVQELKQRDTKGCRRKRAWTKWASTIPEGGYDE